MTLKPGETRFQQVDFPDQLPGDLVRGAARPGDAVDFVALGPQAGEAQFALDRIGLAGEIGFRAGLGASVDALAVEALKPPG
ncbi:hypothetical protein [Bosea vaviloviae]|uniref:Uncharacterized protein n=1 Tax=Bosea vaviloviae TaxID=1526658 RepID=A0A1D7TYZ2_9HYPH|nr:hypothetical protein [Bosea vaviloviae]AOO80339.1 hypothetical protein BHK69_07550 [Bosea vaviloviae]